MVMQYDDTFNEMLTDMAINIPGKIYYVVEIEQIIQNIKEHIKGILNTIAFKK